MIDSLYAALAILCMGLVTFALRALPFVASQWLRKQALVQGLGAFLPLAIMTLLLLHSGVAQATAQAQGAWPALGSVTLVALLQWRLRNALLSILSGTGVYVALSNWL